MLGMNYVDFAYVLAANTRGGVLVAAKGPDVELSDPRIGCFSVTVAVHSTLVGAAAPAALQSATMMASQHPGGSLLSSGLRMRLTKPCS
jgi:hypothetical protein